MPNKKPRRKKYQETHPDRVKEAQRKYYYSHREKRIKAASEWNKNNKERKRENERKWCKNNPDKIKAKNQRNYKSKSQRFNSLLYLLNNEEHMRTVIFYSFLVWNVYKIIDRPKVCMQCWKEAKYIDFHHIDYEYWNIWICCCRSCHSKLNKWIIQPKSTVNLIELLREAWYDLLW